MMAIGIDVIGPVSGGAIESTRLFITPTLTAPTVIGGHPHIGIAPNTTGMMQRNAVYSPILVPADGFLTVLAGLGGRRRVGGLVTGLGGRRSLVEAMTTGLGGARVLPNHVWVVGLGGTRSLFREYTTGLGGTRTLTLTITQVLGGRRRVAEAGADLYVVYLGLAGGPVDFSAPAATSTTLPISISVPPAGGQEINVVVRKRNTYGVESVNQFTYTLDIDAGGGTIYTAIRAPLMSVFVNTGQVLRILARYPDATRAANPADSWRFWWTTTSVDTAVDTPDATATVVGKDVIYTTPALTPGTYKVYAVLRRASDSQDSPATISTGHVVAADPGTPNPVISEWMD